MITTTHAILNTALLGSKDHRERNWPLVLGSIAPDLPMVFYGLLMALGRLHWYSPGRKAFDEYHFRALWVDWAHSFPLAIGGLLLCLLVGQKTLAYFFAAMGLHDLEDLPVHAEYAHRHFLPFSNWRFFSHISYSDPHHYGAIIAPLEWLIVLVSIYFLWKRGLKPPVQLLLVFIGTFQGLWLVYYYGRVHWVGF
jgi:hypothetical protein